MAANSTSAKVASPSPLPVPTSRSPPKYPDLRGKHRKQAELHALNREIGFLEEELQSLDALQPTSRCCKEVDEFVTKNPDPLLPITGKVHKSSRFWKWLCSKSQCYFSWICCYKGCSLHLKRSPCVFDLQKSCQCSFPNWCCQCCCLKKSCRACCVLPILSCPSSCSCCCMCSCSRCKRICHRCSKCLKNCCCLPCILCSY